SLQNKYEIEETFEKVSSEIEEVVNDTEKTAEPKIVEPGIEKSTKRKWRLFDRSQDEVQTIEDTAEISVQPNELLSDVNSRLNSIKREEQYINDKIIDKEIKLILDDRV